MASVFSKGSGTSTTTTTTTSITVPLAPHLDVFTKYHHQINDDSMTAGGQKVLLSGCLWHDRDVALQ